MILHSADTCSRSSDTFMIALTEKCELSLNAIYDRGEDMLERWNEGGRLKSYPRT